MKIYTKTGDKGETGLFGGQRVRKDHSRIVAYGEVDELNALIGWARSENKFPEVDVHLSKIQNDLFDLGAVLATPDKKKLEGKATGFIREQDISYLEQAIDYMEKTLPALQNFILPTGSELASRFHVARTVCRRAERSLVTMFSKETMEENVLVYLNRLSDFLFVLARWVNAKEKIADVEWKKK